MAIRRRHPVLDILSVLVLRGVGMMLGIASALLVAFLFGASALVDAYFLARRTIGSVQSVAEVLIETLLVPAMVRHLQTDGVPSLIRLSHRMGRFIFAGGVVVTGLCALFAGPLVDLLAPGLAAEARGPAIVYFSLLLITVPVTLLTSVDAATLVALRQYSRPALVRLLPRLCLVAALLLVPLRLGLTWAVVAFVAGSLAMLAVFMVLSRRILSRALAAQTVPVDVLVDVPVDVPDKTRLGLTAGHGAATIVLSLAVFAETLIDTYFASLAGVGALVILTLGQRISNIGASEMTRSLLSVYYTRFAEHAAVGRDDLFVAEVATATRAMLFFLAPLGLFLFALAEPLCALMLDFGAFGPDAVTATAQVVAWVAVATVLRGPVVVQENAVLADPGSQHLRFALLSAGLSLMVRGGVVVALLPGFGLMAVVYAAIAAVLAKLAFGTIWLRWRRGLRFGAAAVVQPLVVLALAGLAAGVAAVALSLVPQHAARWVGALGLLACVSVASAGYLIACAAARIPEAAWLLSRLRARIFG